MQEVERCRKRGVQEREEVQKLREVQGYRRGRGAGGAGVQMAQCQKKPTTGKAGACAVKRQRLPSLGLRAAPRVPGGRPFVATPPAAHGGSHSGGAWNGPGRAPSRPPPCRPATGGPALPRRRPRWPRPRGEGKGHAGSPTPRRSAAAATATILDGGPARLAPREGTRTMESGARLRAGSRTARPGRAGSAARAVGRGAGRADGSGWLPRPSLT